MEQAVIMSAVLLVYVVSTQLGRHRAGLVRLLMPIGLVFGIGVPMLGGFDYTTPNLLTVGAGIAIGLAIGACMLTTITVERDPATGKAYTRAGWPYLMIWFGVLGGRLIFVWAVQHVGWFGRVVGEFLRHNHIGTGAVTAFFVLMALAMVLVRSIGLGYRVLVRRSSPGVVTTAVADQASSAMASSSGIRLPPTDQ